MPIEKNLLDADYAYLTDGSGEYVTVPDATTVPLVTSNASLTSKARHLLVRSNGNTVVARSSGKDVFARGGTPPLNTPRSPLVSRNAP